jgi:hypothetical protein
LLLGCSLTYFPNNTNLIVVSKFDKLNLLDICYLTKRGIMAILSNERGYNMLKVTFHKRIKRGWESFTQECSILEARQAKLLRDDFTKLAGEKKSTVFHITKVGDVVPGMITGTLFELFLVGVCIRCLGAGTTDHGVCPDCQGTGSVEPKYTEGI